MPLPVQPKNLDQHAIERLRNFHATHFGNRPVPELNAAQDATIPAAQESFTGEDHSPQLGYYEDGTQRTLTDLQIKMFRHSEVQRIVQERRLAKEKAEKQKQRYKEGHKATTGRRMALHADDPARAGTVDTLLYDEQPVTTSEQDRTAENKRPIYLWPQLGR